MRAKATAGFVVTPEFKRPLRIIRDQRKPWSMSSKSQEKSTFITRLPVEVRHMIYEYILAPDTVHFVRATLLERSKTEASGGSTLLFRPWQVERYGDKSSIYQDTVCLLQLCQFIYLEAQPLCEVGTKMHFLFYPPVRALSFPLATTARIYLSRMTPAQVAEIKQLHLFVASNTLRTVNKDDTEFVCYRSESVFAEIAAIRCGGVKGIKRLPLRPEMLTITIRQTDWYENFWWSHEDRGFDSTLEKSFTDKLWGNVFEGVCRLSIELEVNAAGKPHLSDTLKFLKRFRFRIDEHSTLVPDKDSQTLTWNEQRRRGKQGESLDAFHSEEQVPQGHLLDPDSPEEQTVQGLSTVYKFFWRLQQTAN